MEDSVNVILEENNKPKNINPLQGLQNIFLAFEPQEEIIPEEVYRLRNYNYFKKAVERQIEVCNSEEKYEESNRLSDMIKDNQYFTDRKHWFRNSVNKKVFLTNNKCDCNTCSKLENDGIYLKDIKIAESIFALENQMNIIGRTVKFSLTK